MADSEEPKAGFIDTNVWLYAFIAADDARKTFQAKSLIQSLRPVLSIQVLNEICVNLLRRNIFIEAEVRDLIASFYTKYQVIPPHEAMLLNASDLRTKYSFSFWDSLIVATALSSGVSELYSEDMQHGQVIEGTVTIVNPFLTI